MSTCEVLITTSKQAGDGGFVRVTVYKKILTQHGDFACETTRVVFPELRTKEKKAPVARQGKTARERG